MPAILILSSLSQLRDAKDVRVSALALFRVLSVLLREASLLGTAVTTSGSPLELMDVVGTMQLDVRPDAVV